MEMKYAVLHRASATPEQQIYWSGISGDVDTLYMVSSKGQYVRVVIELPEPDEKFLSLTLTISRVGLHFYHKTLRQEVDTLFEGRGLEDTALDAVAASYRSINHLETVTLNGEGAFLAFIRRDKGAPVDTCFTDL
jgi:hypothetical protein